MTEPLKLEAFEGQFNWKEGAPKPWPGPVGTVLDMGHEGFTLVGVMNSGGRLLRLLLLSGEGLRKDHPPCPYL